MRVLLLSKAMTVPITHSKARLLAQHCELLLVTPKTWPGYVSETMPEPTGFIQKTLAVAMPGRNHFHFYWGLEEVIAKFRPDLIHIDEEPYSLVTAQTLYLANRYGAKSIASTYQNIFKHYPVPFSWIEQNTYRKTSAIVAGNQEAVDILRAKGYRGLTPIIPQFGIETNVFSPHLADKKRFGIAENALSITYVGRLVSEKGIDTLISALSNLGNAHLYIVGTGPEENTLKSLARDLGLQDTVHFLGGMASTQIPHFMSSVQVLALPSLTRPNWKEQFGRVLIEAMASGTVVVGSDSGEIPHVIAEAGLVFREGDSASLHQCLKQLQDNQLRETLRQKGLARATQFMQQVIVDQTLNLYQELLG
jgi:glycosyltransferase involved in cell wall biosynthesis